VNDKWRMVNGGYVVQLEDKNAGERRNARGVRVRLAYMYAAGPHNISNLAYRAKGLGGNMANASRPSWREKF
jgi:hypothetical protein